MRPEVEGGRGQAGADRLCLRLGLAPSDLPPPILISASGDCGLPLTRGDSRLRKAETD